MLLYECLALIDEPSDREKFTELYNTFKYDVYLQAKEIIKDEYLAEDVLQEVFLYVAKNFQRLRMQHEKQIRRYIILCAKSRALNMLEKQNREKAHASEDLDYLDSDSHEPGESFEDTLIETGQIAALMEAVAALDEKYRIPMELTARGLNSVEVGEMVGLTAVTVRKRIERGRKILLKRMRSDGSD